ISQAVATVEHPNLVSVHITTPTKNIFLRISKIGNQQLFRHSLMDTIGSISIYIKADSRYFAIGPQQSEEDQTVLDVLVQQLLNDAEAREAEAQRHMYEIHDRNILQELSPWLRCTNWMTRFDGKDMKVLHDLLTKPKRNPQNPDDRLYLVWESVARVIEQCWESARDCSSRDWKLILHWLASASKTEHNPTPFSIYTE